MRCIDADTLEKILEKIPAADIKNMGGQAYVLVKLSQVFNVIDNQPTIEPDPSQCWGCNCEKMERLEPCEDTISRQDAIDAHYEYCNKHPDAGFPVWSLKILEDLPSAQPERKKGKWIEQEDSWDGVYYECSACGEPWTTIDGTPWDNGMKFCPNCGARMEDSE